MFTKARVTYKGQQRLTNGSGTCLHLWQHLQQIQLEHNLLTNDNHTSQIICDAVLPNNVNAKKHVRGQLPNIQ
jgi:hypothetical protein